VPEQLLISFPAHLSANGKYFRCFVGRFTANYDGIFFFERLTVSILDTFFPTLRPPVRAGHRGGSVGQPPGATIYKGRCDVTGKYFSENCPWWASTLRKIVIPFLERIESLRGRKLLAFAGRQIINISGASNFFFRTDRAGGEVS